MATNKNSSKLTLMARTASLETSEEQWSKEALKTHFDKLRPLLEETAVDLSEGQASSSDVWALCVLLDNPGYEHVTSLNLSSNKLEDGEVTRLASILEKNETITELDLSDNNFTQAAVLSLNIALSVGGALKKLSLEDNSRIDATGIGFIGEILEGSSNLISLNLSGISLDKAMDSLVRGLKENDVLEELVIENVHLDRNSADVLISSLCEADSRSQLQSLSLDFNPNSDFNVFTPLFYHPKFKTLRKLSLSYLFNGSATRARDSPVEIICKNIRNNNTLQELLLLGNNFQAHICTQLANLIMMPTRLQVLDLRENNINIQGARTLQAALSKNIHLRDLKLEGNRFLADNIPAGEKIYAEIREMMAQRERQDSLRRTMPTSKNKRGSTGGSLGTVSKEDGKSEGSPKPKKKKRRGFANKIGVNKVVQPKRFSPKSFEDNLDNEEKTVSFNSDLSPKPKGKGKRRFVGKLKNRSAFKPKAPISPDMGSANDNIDGEYSSVSFLEMQKAPPPKNLRNFAHKKKKLAPALKGGSVNNNLDDDEMTCVIFGAVPDEDESSVIFHEELEDDATVIYEMETGTSIPEVLDLSKTKQVLSMGHPDGEFDTRSFVGDADRDSVARMTDPGQPGWAVQNLGKSELGFLNHMKRMINREERPGEESTGILEMSKEELETLGGMLSEFENLLDREEHLNIVALSLARDNKRPFTRKFGVIGKLKEQDPAKVVSLPLAKSAIDRALISRELARNIVLVTMFDKMRREIGSGVPTKVGGMLPSTLLESLLPDQGSNVQPVFPNIDKLEAFSASFLLIKVVLWSILKALAISRPEVDPQGRHLLEEFGKAMFEKRAKEAGEGDKYKKYESEPADVVEKKKLQLGQHILEGAIFELIDIILLLKPMYSISEALFMTVKTTKDAQPPLAQYDYLEKKGEARSVKKIQSRMKKVNNINMVKGVLLQVKQNKKAGAARKVGKLSSDDSAKGKDMLNGVLKNIYKHKKKKFSDATKKKHGSVPTTTKPKRGIAITEKTLQYRENCPERVSAILSDLQAESKSLSTIVCVEKLLPTLLAFCDYSKVCAHFKRRCDALKKQWPTWMKGLSQDFKNETLEHMMDSIIPAVEPSLKVNSKFVARPVRAPIVKEEKPNELSAILARRRNKQQLSPKKEEAQTVEVKTGTTDQSFYHPLLNQIFSTTEMSEGAVEKVRQIVDEKLGDQMSKKRSNFIQHLKQLMDNGCTETVAMQTVKAQEAVEKMLNL